jgi:hypothetical protein
MQFMDADHFRHRLGSATRPANWTRVELLCPSCQRRFAAWASPREDSVEARAAARRLLIRTCPQHPVTFAV